MEPIILLAKGKKQDTTSQVPAPFFPPNPQFSS